jgi:hypothetical protein
MARTAVIAGTATAVSNKVSMNQAQKYQAQQQAAEAEQAQSQAEMAAAAPAQAPAGDDLMTQLTKLADLKAAGILSEEEFTAAKAKLLA